MLTQGFVRVLHLVLERLSTTNAELSRIVEIDWFEPSKSCPFKSEIAGQHVCQNENPFLSVATSVLPIHFVQQVMEGLATRHLAHWGELKELSYSRSEEKRIADKVDGQSVSWVFLEEITYHLRVHRSTTLKYLKLLSEVDKMRDGPNSPWMVNYHAYLKLIREKKARFDDLPDDPKDLTKRPRRKRRR